ncbi:MAG TPA: hypothetical protein VFL99_13315 [Segeticoccus sp.]|uniref:hypothetical protein n=1 Tax=Segeticoccus sp. TaxID=2706531 RepID=UPI002D7E8E59|nr:hypothetical protein [Segeticoccus sp.]HET8601302.1 hypothetical protein [Segeticoccus sp.]
MTAQTPRARSRRSLVSSAVAAGALAGAVALSGCSALSPQQTTEPYTPADGVSTTLGNVDLNDLLIVASAKGKPGVVSAQVSNQGNSRVTVKISSPDGTTLKQVSVPAQSAVKLFEGGHGQTTLPSVPVPPGSMTKLRVSTPSEGTHEILVPVLLDQQYYATVTPTSSPSPSSTSSTSSASPSSSK